MTPENKSAIDTMGEVHLAVRRAEPAYESLAKTEDELQKIRKLFGLEFDKRPLSEALEETIKEWNREKSREIERMVASAEESLRDRSGNRELDAEAILDAYYEGAEDAFNQTSEKPGAGQIDALWDISAAASDYRLRMR